jgi:hypothetical protein
MWKLWKTSPIPGVSEILERLRLVEATVKAQDLEIESLHTFVKKFAGRYDKKTALDTRVSEVQPLSREQILARGKFDGGRP